MSAKRSAILLVKSPQEAAHFCSSAANQINCLYQTSVGGGGSANYASVSMESRVQIRAWVLSALHPYKVEEFSSPLATA